MPTPPAILSAISWRRAAGSTWRPLGGAPPPLIIDIHGCVGTRPQDDRVIVGLGGFPPLPQPADLGEPATRGAAIHLRPHPRLRQGLELLRELSAAIHIQFCSGPQQGYHFLLQDGAAAGRPRLGPGAEVRSLLTGEERTWLPGEDIRWLPGAGGNALQRLEARRLRPDALCLHVEIPTRVRRGIAMRLREMAISDSLSRQRSLMQALAEVLEIFPSYAIYGSTCAVRRPSATGAGRWS